jgi:drug/metabolite transporter (DMT)-like permease
MPLTSRTRAESYLLSLTIIWGSTFVLTKFILEDASPLVYVAIRFFAASLLFGVLFFRRLRTISKNGITKGLVLGVLLFFGFILQTIGMKFTTASKSAFITGLMVVFTPIFQLIIERKAPKIGNSIGVVLVAIGLYFLTSPKGSEFNIGDALTLVCAVLFSIYTVYLSVYGKDHDPAHLTFIQFAFTALFAVIAIPFLETARLHMTFSFLLNLAYLAVMPTVVALYVMAKYQKYTTPTRSAIIYSMEPPFAAIFAFFIMGEHLGMMGAVGGIIILFGLIVSELSDVIFTQKNKESYHPGL